MADDLKRKEFIGLKNSSAFSAISCYERSRKKKNSFRFSYIERNNGFCCHKSHTGCKRIFCSQLLGKS